MEIQSAQQLIGKKCEPCEAGVDPCPLPLVKRQLESLPGWQLSSDNQRIRKEWNLGSFLRGLEFFQAVSEIAEAEAHHPDLHLVNYREVSIEIWTHTVGGLSENDFILAAKIDEIPLPAGK